MSQKHSCFCWWWAHSCPKHVEIDTYTKTKLWTQVGFIYKIDTGEFVECRGPPNLVKIGPNYRALYMKTCVSFIVPAILNSHKSALFEWNGFRLLGDPRKYKYYANAARCYVLRVWPILFSYPFMYTIIVPLLCLYWKLRNVFQVL